MERNNMCGAVIQWSFMYGEAEMLMRNSTLFEDYPRFCQHYYRGRMLARPSQTWFYFSHGINCSWKNKTRETWTWRDNFQIALVHYFSKSVEEFLIKIDQGMPPYVRRPIDSYYGSPTCQLSHFNYSDDYRNTFVKAYKRLEVLHPTKATRLIPSPGLTIKQVLDYPLFIHLQYRCAKRHRFDNEKYLSIHPDAKAAVEKGTIVDGLYHFMANFTSGVKGCWKTSNYLFGE